MKKENFKTYLYLGEDTTVKKRDVIGVFDMEKCTVSTGSRGFLKMAEDCGKVVNVTYELPHSFVLCDDKVYVCQLTPSTLKKRW